MSIIKPVKPFTFVGGAGKYAYASEVNSDFDTLYNKMNELIDSLNNLEGSALSPDARIDVGHNEDGTHKSGIVGGAEYISTVTPTYVSGTQFTVSGDQTSIFLYLRKVKASLSASTVYSEVVSSSYSAGTGLTTVIILDSVLSSPLSSVDVSVARPEADDGAITAAMIGSDILGVLLGG